jgi:hypothetical protein|tara:strand:+ start:43 stop:435 length:393 start_codon:yes stop_codon:yes gene_type:complete
LDIIKKLKQVSKYTKVLAKNQDIEKLSEKKKTALNSITYGLTQTTLDEEFKQAFFNSAFLMLRMINDNEVDKLALANYEASQAYMMMYFYNDIDKLDLENKEAFKFLFRDYENENNESLPENFKEKFWLR